MEAISSNKQPDQPDCNKSRRSGGHEFVDGAQRGSGGRHIHSGYAAIINLINDKSDDIGETDSDKFMNIMDKVEKMHQHVDKPREQVMDAEALLSLVGSLESRVMSEAAGGITPAYFVSCLLKEFGQFESSGGDSKKQIRWEDIGRHVSSIFRNGRGCCTMLGPMKNELKQRKVGVHRKHTRTSTKSQPEELSGVTEKKTDTDKSMSTMFEILRKKRSVKVENLLLNRKSFAQTVENLFALSFLVKDGRVVIAVDEKGSHLVSPRNAPSSSAVMSKEVVYSHFIFRFGFSDWKLMKDLVPEGEELMPVRNGLKVSGASQAESLPDHLQAKHMPESSQAEIPSMPVGAKVFSRNRGVFMQGQNAGEVSPETAGSWRHRNSWECEEQIFYGNNLVSKFHVFKNCGSGVAPSCIR